MLPDLPPFISLTFMLTTFLTVWFFYRAARRSGWLLIILMTWLAVQGGIALSGFYTVTDTLPPRFALFFGPALLTILTLFLIPAGKKWIDTLSLEWLTWLHIIRIPVELVLYWLAANGKVSDLMTFEGRNFDILSGITAPIVAYFAFRHQRIGKKTLLVWNVVCLGLLVNIVAHAVLAVPTPFQQIAFDQPNIAVLYFPFVWLPCYIVPIVLFSHLAAIRKLVRK